MATVISPSKPFKVVRVSSHEVRFDFAFGFSLMGDVSNHGILHACCTSCKKMRKPSSFHRCCTSPARFPSAADFTPFVRDKDDERLGDFLSSLAGGPHPLQARLVAMEVMMALEKAENSARVARLQEQKRKKRQVYKRARKEGRSPRDARRELELALKHRL